MKPRLKIVEGRAVVVRVESPQLAEARRRFSLNTGENGRKFIGEQGSRYQRYPESCLSRWSRKAPFLNVSGK